MKKLLTVALIAGALAIGGENAAPLPIFATAEASATKDEAKSGVDYMILVNKDHKLPDDYEARLSLVTVKNAFGKTFKVERETYKHFAKLREDLLKSGIHIELESAYRSVAAQRDLIKKLKETEGEDYVKNFAAVPGFSEHHTGLALDVTVVEDGKPVNDVYDMDETPYQKMHRKIADHGFILRYPPGKSGVTGYEYESWHIRYVGAETARKIFRQGLTFEEYLKGGAETRAMRGKYGSAEYWTRRNPDGDEIVGSEKPDKIREAVRKKIREKTCFNFDLPSYPMFLSVEEVLDKIKFARDSFERFEADKIYENGAPVPEERYREIIENCGEDAISGRIEVRYALTVGRANLRYLPVSAAWYESAKSARCDLAQGITKDPAEPLAILAESRDKRFFFAENRGCLGWVDKSEIVFVDRDKWMEYANPKDFLVVTDSTKKIRAGGKRNLTFQMGARLPLKKPSLRSDGTWLVSIPVKVGEKLREVSVSVPDDDTVHKGWLPYSQNTLIRQAFRFLGSPCGRCGLDEGVDCSLFTADVYRSVGIDLPTDSDKQCAAMPVVAALEGMDEAKKIRAISNLEPGDFLCTKGHIMIYLGNDDSGTPYVIQAESSRCFPGEGEDGGTLKYFIRRVTVGDLYSYKSPTKKSIDCIISANGFRADK